MNAASPKPPERKIVLLLCLLSAIHVIIFSSAFPFFNDVDEPEHFDLVLDYAHGNVPHFFSPLSAETVRYMGEFCTWEYLNSPNAIPYSISEPPWNWPDGFAQKIVKKREMMWQQATNPEMSQAPLYYSMAGGEWRLARGLGLNGGTSLYAVRFLNAIFVASIVAFGWLITRKVFPENIFVRIAVPSVIAFLPQTTFYSVNNDILSPLTFGILFYGLLSFWESGQFPAKTAAKLGLSFAAVYLTKISNLPLLAVATFFIFAKVIRLAHREQRRQSISSFLIWGVCAGAPIAAWSIWCHACFGDFSGTDQKARLLGWTSKPFLDWFHHPLFTPQGFWFFVKENLSTFWQGEFIWWLKPLTLPDLNLFYTLLTIIALLTTLIALVLHPQKYTSQQRTGLWFGLGCAAATFLFYAVLSVKYDFHDCFYPSRQHPFFVSGRLMLGMLIPFMLAFVAGLDRLMKNFCDQAKFILLGALIAFMLASEIITDWPVFFSEYNWFHM